MLTVTVHDSQFDVPVGNIFNIWELVEPLVEQIHRCPGWSYTVTLAAGTRSLSVVLRPIDGLTESVTHRTVTYYRTPRVDDSVLRVSRIRGVLAAEVIPLEDVALDADEDIPAEFLYG